MKNIFLTIFIICIIAVKNFAVAAEIPPAPSQNIYVADYAAMLDDSTKEKISAIGKALDEKYKAQVSVVTIQTLGDSNLEEYAHELFNKWKLGDKNLNNGVLLLIAKDDRKFRIEVGYGLEGAITDGYAGSILDSMKNYFREEKYSAGTLLAYSILTKKIYEEYGGEIPADVAENANEEETIIDYIFIVFGVLVMLIIFWHFVAIIIGIAIYICCVAVYAVTLGKHGTLNIKTVFNAVEKYSGLVKIRSVLGSSSGGGFGIFGGGSSGGGGGRSGGGGASGGW